jgi:hypothetical protein
VDHLRVVLIKAAMLKKGDHPVRLKIAILQQLVEFLDGAQLMPRDILQTTLCHAAVGALTLFASTGCSKAVDEEFLPGVRWGDEIRQAFPADGVRKVAISGVSFEFTSGAPEFDQDDFDDFIAKPDAGLKVTFRSVFGLAEFASIRECEETRTATADRLTTRFGEGHEKRAPRTQELRWTKWYSETSVYYLQPCRAKKTGARLTLRIRAVPG